MAKPLLRHRTLIATLACLIFLPVSAFAAEAEIVSLTGKADKRDTAQTNWQPAAIKQTVKAGGFVRTHEMSQLALLMPDRTQLRLNQNSQMQIKTVAEAAEWSQSVVKLNSGRAWSQARPPSAPSGVNAPQARISMETPSATLSIRGTDWEVEVGPDGRTQLVVLSGVVDIANEQGALKVNPGEAAVAEVGKAPVRLVLANPRERIQWVTAWTPQPQRWIAQPDKAVQAIIEQMSRGDFAAATQGVAKLPASVTRDLLAADLAMSQGDSASAIAHLKPHAREGKGQAAASALLARIHLALGDADAAATLLATAAATHPDDGEILLAQAELAIFRGDATVARSLLSRVIGDHPANSDAWYTKGRVETERENLRSARAALTAALDIRPDFTRVQAERGTLETLAGNYADATAWYDKALTATPDDYVALTGRGIMKLKTGDARGALDDFLRAGVIEPRFARAWLYSAAAFYQLGELKRAQDALTHASQLDPNDPLPYVMRGLMAADALDLGAAVDTAREAQARMPYLKSLNQVLNNQKGSANVGSALANFGMEEWARYYAVSAYSPWWAGSNLFLADRQVPGFNKNSELFKGFLTDPTVFGASQRYSSLVATPGHYGRADFFTEHGNWQQSALIGTANGLIVDPVPLAYFVSGDLSTGESRLSGDAAHASNLTVGLGIRPNDSLGIFMFGTNTHISGNLANSLLPDDTLAIDDTRFDIGANYKHNANNQFWLKVGGGTKEALVEGQLSLAGTTIPLDQARYRVRQSDVQFRHTFAPVENMELSWGYEDARQRKPANFDYLSPATVTNSLYEITRLHSQDAYLVARGTLAPEWRGELGVFVQHAAASKYADQTQSGPGGKMSTLMADTDDDHHDANWRGGLQWHLSPQASVTLVSQAWRRPASTNTLAPIDTLGIAVNDELTSNGGRYRRERLQADLEISQTTYLQGFIDHERVNNISSPLTAVVPDLQLTQLESLQNRRDAFTFQPELEKTPAFLEGRVDSVGFALNQRIMHDMTLALRYRHADAEQTGVRDGLKIPYLPRDYLRVASFWSLPDRWLLGASATWRGERYSDEANTLDQRIRAGWIYGLSAYWESADKRWVTQAILDNLRRDRGASADQSTKLILRLSYLF